jgi:hypothetical protein
MTKWPETGISSCCKDWYCCKDQSDTVYGNTSKHVSVVYVLEWIFHVNSMVISIDDWSVIEMIIYGDISKHINVVYVLKWLWCEFNGGVCWYCHIRSPHTTCIKKSLQNIYNTYMFAGIAICGHSNHKTDITIKFTLKNGFKTYITLMCLLVLPYMVTSITKWTSALNSHQKMAPNI